MKKLNNKGMTTIEVVICFVIVVVITMSMYNTISTFNDQRILEGYKEQIYIYKNILTKEIQDDIIMVGLVSATYNKDTSIPGKNVYTVKMELKDGTTRILEITQQLTKSTYHIGGVEGINDEFMIEYNGIKYPLPNLGSTETEDGKTALDLSINNVMINVDDYVLSIYIGLYHPEFSTRYGINIVCPIDYISTGSDGTNSFDFDF